ncbi:MAG: YggT family protein [Anaerolineae bacterium]|nr:YggT family protein [Anaerolineae bacterium]
MIFYIWQLLLLARILLSWIQVDPYHPAVQFLYAATEPVLRPIREALPQTGMFDFSPLIAIILAELLRMILIQIVNSVF